MKAAALDANGCNHCMSVYNVQYHKVCKPVLPYHMGVSMDPSPLGCSGGEIYTKTCMFLCFHV